MRYYYQCLYHLLPVMFICIVAVPAAAQVIPDRYQFPSKIIASNDIFAFKAEDLARVGEFQKATEIYSKGRGEDRKTYSEKIKKKLSGLKYRSAKEYILEQARNRQIVIINEAHHKPQHRVFTESILADLYKMGFRYMGLESLTNDHTHVDVSMDTALNTRRYPLLSSGPYVSEPNYGNMLRSALEEGYTVFPYETQENLNRTPREERQARNIANLLKEHPGAKIIIHCGYGHAAKCYSAEFKSKLMAGFLKEYSGIDPLTIDQTTFTEDEVNEFGIFGDDEAIDPMVFFTPATAVVNDAHFKNKDSVSCYDIMVYHHMLPYKNLRPPWKLIPSYTSYYVNLQALKMIYPIMVKAYINAEDKTKAVPSDVIIIENSNTNKPLILKKGSYQLIITSISGQVTEVPIKVI